MRAHTQTETYLTRCGRYMRVSSGSFGASCRTADGVHLSEQEICMKPRTKQNLMNAIQSEAFAHAMYKHFAERARSEDELGLAQVFQKAADSQWTEHFAGEIGACCLRADTTENLRISIEDEAELSQMYAQFADEAREDGDLRAASLFEKVRVEKANKHTELELTLERLGCSSGLRTVSLHQ